MPKMTPAELRNMGYDIGDDQVDIPNDTLSKPSKPQKVIYYTTPGSSETMFENILKRHNRGEPDVDLPLGRKLPERALKQPRRRTGEMNKTEARFERWIREEAKREGATIVSLQFEQRKFRLADDKCWFTPDFYVVYRIKIPDYELGGTYISYKHYAYDVKARWGDKPGVKDDALVKIKVAATNFPEIVWAITWPTKDKMGFEYRYFHSHIH